MALTMLIFAGISFLGGISAIAYDVFSHRQRHPDELPETRRRQA